MKNTVIACLDQASKNRLTCTLLSFPPTHAAPSAGVQIKKEELSKLGYCLQVGGGGQLASRQVP